MVTDSNDNIIHMSNEEAQTYGEIQIDQETVDIQIDDDLGLAVKPKQTIFQKYGVQCDPTKNSFYQSLNDQFEKSGKLSEKQINALRNPRY